MVANRQPGKNRDHSVHVSEGYSKHFYIFEADHLSSADLFLDFKQCLFVFNIFFPNAAMHNQKKENTCFFSLFPKVLQLENIKSLQATWALQESKSWDKNIRN